MYAFRYEARLRGKLPDAPALRRPQRPFDVARARHGPDSEGPILQLGRDRPPGGALNAITGLTYVQFVEEPLPKGGGSFVFLGRMYKLIAQTLEGVSSSGTDSRLQPGGRGFDSYHPCWAKLRPFCPIRQINHRTLTTK